MKETFPEGARDKMCEILCNTIRRNEQFMWDHARSIYNEITTLSLESISIMDNARTHLLIPDWYLSSARLFFANHALAPFGSGILSACLDGNIPACFMMLRLLLETLLICWFADKDCSDLEHFDARLDTIHKKYPTTAPLCKRLDSELNTGRAILDQWSSLSSDWVHSYKQTTRFVDAIASKGNPPSWSLMIPISYTMDDVEFLELLGSQVQQFRRTLKTAVEKWPEVR